MAFASIRRRLRRSVSPVLLCLWCWALSSPQLAAQSIVVGDDFERPDAPLDGDGWTVFDGDWNLVDGALRAGPASATEQHAFVGSPATEFPAGDFTLDVDLTFQIPDGFPGPGRHAGVAFCFDQPGSRLASSGYLVWYIDREGDRGLSLTRRDAGGLTTLAAGSLLPEEGPPQTITVEVFGPTITVLADGEVVIVLDDDTYRGGYFGLWTWNGADQAVDFDNFALTVDPIAIDCCFEIQPATPQPGGDVIFDAGCSSSFAGTIVDYRWDFGDGRTTTGQVAEHIYDFADTYVVALTVEDDQGNDCTVERTVSVVESIVPFEEDFDGFDPGTEIDGWVEHSGDWEITDDGRLRIVSTQAENHIWAGDPPGLITGDVTIRFDMEFPQAPADGVGRHAAVMLYAQDPVTRWDTRAYSIWWIDRTTDFGVGLHEWTGGALREIQVSKDRRPDIQDPPTEWWVTVEGPRIRVFGDGNPLPILDVEDESVERFGHFGFWSYGPDREVTIDNVEVLAGAMVPESGEVFPCATVGPDTISAGKEATFDASCTVLPDGVTAMYEWDFGDGSTGTGEVVTHVYDFEDSYVVELTVVPRVGEAKTFSLEVTVLPAGVNDIPDFTIAPETTATWVRNADGSLEVMTSGGGARENETHIWVGDPPIVFSGDIAIEWEVEFLNSPQDGVGRHAGLFFFAADTSLRWNNQAYDVWWIDRAQDQGLGIHRWSPLTFLTPGSGIEFPDLGVVEPPSRWRVEITGATIAVYGDDELLAQADDETLREGHIGFWAYGTDQHVKLSNLCIDGEPYLGSCESERVIPCFEVSADTPGLDEAVDFDAGCTTAPDGVTVTAYNWDFGDGETATGEQVSHTYSVGGEYEVVLTVEHTGGDAVTRTRRLRVVEKAALPISEDFEQAPGAVEGWTVSDGQWSVTDDGKLEVITDGSSEAHIWYGDPPKVIDGDLTFEFEVEFVNHNPIPDDAVGKHAGVFFYSAEPIARASSQSYDVWWIDRPQDFGIGIHRWSPLEFLTPGSGVEFPELGLFEPPERWRVEISGPTIRAYGDDELLAEAENQARRSGYFGFWAYSNNQRVLFDNLCIVEGPFEGSPDCDAPPPGAVFRRGDTDGNGSLEITDPINSLSFQFLGSFQPPCRDAADFDDNGKIEITDPIANLSHQFLGQAPPPAPGKDNCGPDPSPDDANANGTPGEPEDDLGCEQYPAPGGTVCE